MAAYKRNQVEDALSRVLEPRSEEPSSELRTRLKRLLETDRALGRVSRANDPARANYAFFSADGQGSGVEVWFSEYEAFSLLNGLRLMAHGWPQSFAVSIMRRVRAELEKDHARILKQDPNVLFDQAAIRQNAKAGGFAVGNTDPVFLAIVSSSGEAPRERGEPIACAVRRGADDANKWAMQMSGGAGGFALFELVTLAHTFANRLTDTEPRLRGRSG
jgi:hypothetical protein